MPKLRSKESHPGCLAACHQTHRAMTAKRSARKSSLDTVCLGCHGGNSQPTVDLGAFKLSEQGAVSRHGRSFLEGARPFTRVVQPGTKGFILRDDCSGCHDVHGKEPGMRSSRAFDARGQYLGIKPVFIAQVCFGCHAGPEAAPLRTRDSDLGALFGKGKGSSHAMGRSAADRPDLPSLRTAGFWGKLDCTSCHDNPDPRGPRGPHASPYPFLLKAAFGREKDAGMIGIRSNELCYTCHDRYSIEGNLSFPLHREHLTGFTKSLPLGGKQGYPALGPGAALPPGFRMGRRATTTGGASSLFAGFGDPTPCATCHDPHGSPTNPGLIQFDKTVVTRSSVGGVDFYRSGLGHGSCTLTCHGYDHVQTRY